MKRFILAMAAVASLTLLAASPAMADDHGHRRSHHGHRHPTYNSHRGHGHSGPIYHRPSLHFDRVYHPTYQHWTPGRGLHTHGHYDIVPHYTPGHYDYRHGNHIHTNPWYHH